MARDRYAGRTERVRAATSEQTYHPSCDAYTLREAMEVQANPQRVRDAQEYVRQQLESNTSILGIPVPPDPRRTNMATIMKLPRGY